MKQYCGSYFSVKKAAAIEPKKPPTDMQVQEKELRSSAPLSGNFLAWITISESTMTSEKAILKFDKKSINVASCSV